MQHIACESGFGFDADPTLSRLTQLCVGMDNPAWAGNRTYAKVFALTHDVEDETPADLEITGGFAMTSPFVDSPR